MTGIAPARLLATLAIVAVIALLAVGLIQLASSSSTSSVSTSRLTLAQVQARLAGSPAPLAALHAQTGQVLSGARPRCTRAWPPCAAIRW